MDKVENCARIAKAWSYFRKIVRSEERACDIIFTGLKRRGRIFCECGCSGVEREKGAREFVCKACKKKTHFTVNTPFEGSSNLRAWLAAIYFAENKVVVNGHQFSKLLKIAPATGRHIVLQSVLIVLDSMTELTELVSGWNFGHVIFRRSSETPAREHPIAEQEVIQSKLDEDQPNDLSNSSDQAEQNDSFTNSCASAQDAEIELLDTEQREILALLSDVPRSVDDLCQLTGKPADYIAATVSLLEIYFLAEETTGGRFIRKMTTFSKKKLDQPTCSTEVEALIAMAIAFIKEFFQGVSRKCLQIYLAWFYVWLEAKIQPGTLFTLFLDHTKVEAGAVRTFVSPPLLQMPCGLAFI